MLCKSAIQEGSRASGDAPGAISGSMEPLNWAQGEYITLLADIAAGAVLDIPQAVCARYSACAPAPGPGQVQTNINVNAATQWGQYLYLTGDTDALGNWNANLGLPLDSASYPVWRNAINLTAGSAVQYKYYRKNPDGSVTWECYPGGGNCNGARSLSAVFRLTQFERYGKLELMRTTLGLAGRIGASGSDPTLGAPPIGRSDRPELTLCCPLRSAL